MQTQTRTAVKYVPDRSRADEAEITSIVELASDVVASMKAITRRALAHHRAVLAAHNAEGR